MSLSDMPLLQKSGGPLYMQLYRYFTARITEGELKSGEKLPSKRELAARLSVSLNTVDTAYQMLVAEGYAAARPKSGYYVCRIDRLPSPSVPAIYPTVGDVNDPTLLPSPFKYDFKTSGVDPSLFPYKTWARIQREVLSEHPDFLDLGDRAGEYKLRCAIVDYLRDYRGVRCIPDQIVVGAGIEYLIGLLAGLFYDRVFALEDPGYERVQRVLANNRVSTVFIPVDQSGIDVRKLEDSSARVAYLTPSHQFPTGAILPMSRRQELLAWAQKTDSYIIEDDYDSEFRFDTRPIPALQGLDGAGRVIYIGTFSRVIAPSIRIAFMVLPESLVTEFKAHYADYSPTVSRFEQYTLYRFIHSGAFTRHLNRARIAYRARRDLLIRSLESAFGREHLTLFGAHTGLHLLVRVELGLSESELVQTAEKVGVRVRGLSEYYLGDSDACPPQTLVLGYSAMAESEIEAACAVLKTAWCPDGADPWPEDDICRN